MKPKPARLTHSGRSLDQLLDHLETKADLPAQMWKRLYIGALRRLGKRQKNLANLCRLEAFDLWFTASVLWGQGNPAVQTGVDSVSWMPHG